ncbi:MAG: SecY-interacting protein Syd [Candidatus Phlomobacter fragariae]
MEYDRFYSFTRELNWTFNYAKNTRRLTPILFIASLDSEFEIISVDNINGQVMLETLVKQHVAF